MSKAYVEVPGKVWLFVMIGSGLGLLSSNPLLTVTSLMILPFLIFSLWRKGEAPILSFLLFFQWLESTLKVFNADFAGIRVEGVVKMGEGIWATYFYSKEATKAIGLCLGALASLAIGMRLGISRIRRSPSQEFQIKASPFSIEKLFGFYLITFIISAFSNFLVWRFLSLSQILLAMMSVKWAILYLLVYTILQRKSRHVYLVLVFIMEISAGFISYFAQFRGVIYIVAVAFLALHFRFRARHILAGLFILLIALYLGSVWSVVKKDIRTFMDQAEQEEISLSLEKRVQKVTGLVQGFNSEKIQTGLVRLVGRISYVDFFSQVLLMVPRSIPHEGGELWKKALIHVMTPRLFFRNKTDLEPDSDVTRRYTNIQVAGGSKGGKTSIGIGYVAESYVDFGPKFMFVPIFLVGLLEGLICRYFISKSKMKLTGSALSVATLLFSGSSIAISAAKILGGVLTNFIVLVLFLKLFERSFIQEMTSKSLIRFQKS